MKKGRFTETRTMTFLLWIAGMQSQNYVGKLFPLIKMFLCVYEKGAIRAIHSLAILPCFSKNRP